MAIDRKQWEDLIAQQRPGAQKIVEFRTIELSQAWSSLLESLRDRVEREEVTFDGCLAAIKNDGSYNYEKMVIQKVYMDISHAKLLLLREIEEEVKNYHKEDDHGT